MENLFLKRRSFFSTVVISILAFLLIEGITIFTFYRTAKFETIRNAETGIFELSEVTSPFFNENQHIMTIISSSINELMSDGADNELIHKYMEDTTDTYRDQVDSNFRGIFGEIRGEFIDGSNEEMPAGYDPYNTPWYKAARIDGEHAGFTKPHKINDSEFAVYFYEMLHEHDSVVAIDIRLNSIEDIIKTIHTKGVTAMIIMDSDYDIIAHSNPELVGANFMTNPSSPDEKAFCESVYSHLNQTYQTNVSGHFSTVSTKSLEDSWTAVIVVDVLDEFFNFSTEILIFTLILLIALVIVLIISYRNHSRKLVADMLSKQLHAAAMIYRSLHIFNLQDDSFEELNSTDSVRAAIGEDLKNAASAITNGMRSMVTEDSAEEMLDFVNLNTLADRLKGKRTITHEFLSKDSGWCRARFVVVDTDSKGKAIRVLYALEVIDEEKRRENQLRYLSETDGLTGINNRATGERIIREHIDTDTEGLFCLLDADKFKSVNDNYGHNVGDAVICAIANALKDSFRDKDVVLRLGGDEFAFYAVGVTDTDIAKRVLERFFEHIDAINIPELGDRKICVSVGGAFYTEGCGLDFTGLYEKADKGTYESKKTSGNKYTIIE